MSLSILFFAWLRERAGRGEEVVTPPATVTDIATLIDWLRARGGGPADALADLNAVRVAVNHQYVDFQHPVKAGDEVAFFPPVTGGAVR